LTTLKNLATTDRPREKILRFGPDFLTNFELLALLLNNSGQREKSVLELAREILGPENSFRAIAGKEVKNLKKIKGMGEAKSAMLLAVFELARRFEQEKKPLPKIFDSAAKVAAHFSARLRDYTHEVFILISLNSRNQLIEFDEIASGDLHSVETNPRKIFSTAFGSGAAGIILLHNHPSGSPEPSISDKDITCRIDAIGKLIGVPLLDHIILGEDSYFSFQEKNLLSCDLFGCSFSKEI